MNGENKIKIAIGILLVCLIFILIVIRIGMFLQKGESVVKDKNITEKNETSNWTNNTNQSNVNEDSDDYIFYNEKETGDVEYNSEQLKNIEFEFDGITDDISKYINDIDTLELKIKEFVYLEGLVDATVAKVQKYEYQESTGRLGIIFDLNNPSEDKIRVILNANGSIDISKI